MHTVYADSWDLDSINQSQEIQGWANPDISTLNCYGSCPTCNCGWGYREKRDLSETGIQFQIIKNIVNRILGLLALILPLVANILVQFWLAKKFGKWIGFWFWLLFLNPIFIGILAFDDSTYNANNIKKSE